MATELEATFLDIDKEQIRSKLKSLDATLMRPEYKQCRYNFDLQSLGRNFWEWTRVRDEGDRVTMAYKCIPPDASINDQKEIEFVISDLERGVEFLEAIGAYRTNYSETLRETWELDGITIDIDTWPYLEPYVEIEGDSEEKIKMVSEKLGFDYKDAQFCGAGEIYAMKFGVHPDKLAKEKGSMRLTFEDPNPFL